MIIKGMSDDQKRININLKAKVVRSNDLSCKGCFFYGAWRCTVCCCLAEERKDKKNVIWVEDKSVRP